MLNPFLTGLALETKGKHQLAVVIQFNEYRRNGNDIEPARRVGGIDEFVEEDYGKDRIALENHKKKFTLEQCKKKEDYKDINVN